jgi:hypothetical protein
MSYTQHEGSAVSLGMNFWEKRKEDGNAKPLNIV